MNATGIKTGLTLLVGYLVICLIAIPNLKTTDQEWSVVMQIRDAVQDLLEDLAVTGVEHIPVDHLMHEKIYTCIYKTLDWEHTQYCEQILSNEHQK